MSKLASQHGIRYYQIRLGGQRGTFVRISLSTRDVRRATFLAGVLDVVCTRRIDPATTDKRAVFELLREYVNVLIAEDLELYLREPQAHRRGLYSGVVDPHEPGPIAPDESLLFALVEAGRRTLDGVDKPLRRVKVYPPTLEEQTPQPPR